MLPATSNPPRSLYRVASVQETLGFQFWRSGYWKNHLRCVLHTGCVRVFTPP